MLEIKNEFSQVFSHYNIFSNFASLESIIFLYNQVSQVRACQ